MTTQVPHRHSRIDSRLDEQTERALAWHLACKKLDPRSKLLSDEELQVHLKAMRDAKAIAAALPTMKYLPDQLFTTCGTGSELAPFMKNWKRAFPTNDIRVPEGWARSFEMDGRMVTVSYIHLSNTTKVNSGKYIIVHCVVSRGELLGQEPKGSTTNGKMYFILPVMAFLRPQQEEGAPAVDADTYLQQAAVCKFSHDQLETLRREKKIRVT